MKKKSRSNPASNIIDHYDGRARIVLHQGDALKFIETLPEKSIKLIFTSPPYNMGKEYETNKPIDNYLQEQKGIVAELYRVLADEGSICWQVGSYVQNGEVFPLDILYYTIFKETNFYLRNRIIWRYGHGLHATKKFSGRYETILWFTKSNQYTFNLDSVRIKAKYPGKTFSKGPKKGLLSGNPLGKNPSDVWDIYLNDWEQGIWDIPNVKANHPEKTDHPCQFPVELVERCVLALSDEGDRVLDPFSGVGSTLIAALKNKRKAIGCEKEKKYIAKTKQRINHLLAGTLKLRTAQPVFQPNSFLKVAQVPHEWKNSIDSIYSTD
jgi:adenine-specific DNA-methyltransferase